VATVAGAATLAPDPAVAAWEAFQAARENYNTLDDLACEARRNGLDPTAARREADAAAEVEYAAIDRLIFTKPTTLAGVFAKITAASLLLREEITDDVERLLASLLNVDPSTLRRA
jgi:hypothetical protein